MLVSMKVELPECELGYTDEQLHRILGDRFREFNFWMSGQTRAMCDGRRYSYEKNEYESTGCGPHGGIVYPWDLIQFLNGKPNID